jgi:eukaryotic-like serine/threonine-protein kinase
MGSSPIAAGIVSFGEFEADLRSRELLRQGSKVKLTDQSFCVLAMLLERPGELVTREEIAKKLWPADTFVDFDHGLNNAVNRLREALGDSADSPRFVETLPRRGYRFIAKTNGAHLAGALSASQLGAAEPLPEITHSAVAGTRGEIFTAPRSYRWTLWAIPIIVALAVLLVFEMERRALPPSSRTFVLPPEGNTFNLVGDWGGSVGLSPDGTKLAFVAVDSKAVARVWVRELRKLNSDAIEGTEGASFPFWSPDGRSLGFFANGKLKKASLDGGPAITLSDASFGRGGSWNSQGVIIFAPASHTGIYRIADSGGQPIQITSVDASIHTTHRWPKFLPDGEHFIYLAASHFDDASHNAIYRGSLDGKTNDMIVATSSDAIYKSGYLFFMRKDVLMAQRFDDATARFQGEARPTVERVLYDPSIWKSVFDASDNGVMAYQLGVKTQGSQFVWFDRSGKELSSVGEPNYYWDPRFSRDGKKLSYSMDKPGKGYADGWVMDMAHGVTTRITSDKYDDGGGILTRDNSRVVLSGKRQHYNIYSAAADGSEEPRLLLEDPTSDIWPVDLSPDDRFLLFAKGEKIARTKSQLWIYDMIEKGPPYRLLDGDAVETNGRFSPDGRWIAYDSKQSGRNEVYVRRFDPNAAADSAGNPPGRKWRVSTSGGIHPVWRKDGRELFFVNPDRIIVALPVKVTGSQFEMGDAKPLFYVNSVVDLSAVEFDVSPDGNKILVNVSTPERAAPITIVENWPSDFAK